MQSDLHFLRSLPLTAASLGNKLGVRVLVGGNLASTDGKVIRLPAMSGVVSQDEMLGYVMHEAAHVRLTNFRVAKNSRKFPPVRWEILNALEDVRIENEIEKVYEGAGMILDGCREVGVEKLSRNIDKFETNPAGTLALYCLCHGYVNWTGLDYVEPLYADLAVLMEKHFGADIKNEIDAVLLGLPHAKSTEDAAALADRIIDLLKGGSGVTESGSRNQGTVTKSRRSGSSGSASRQQQCDRQHGRADDAEEADKAEKGEKKSSNPGNSSDSSASQQTGNGTQYGREGGSDACRRTLCAGKDEFDHSLDISKTYGEQIAKTCGEPPLSFDLNDELDLTEVMRKVRRGCTPMCRKPLAERSTVEETGDACIREALEGSAGVRRALRGLIQAKTRRGIWTSRQGRRISATSVARLAVWNTRVFEKRREVKAADTALHVLLDLSGSMQRDVHLARRAALTLTAALIGLPHVNPALSTFNGMNYFCPIVPHGCGSLFTYAGRIGLMSAGGYTPLHMALLAAGISLSRTKEEKKAVLVVTDGFPSNRMGAVQVARALRASGVRIYGLGIATDDSPDVEEIFDVYVSIRSISDIEAALLKIGAQVAFEANGAGRG